MFNHDCVTVDSIYKIHDASDNVYLGLKISNVNRIRIEFEYKRNVDNAEDILCELENEFNVVINEKQKIISGLSILSRNNRIQCVTY